MTKYLVTGGAGFIGSNFVRSLENADPNSQIVVIDNLRYAGSETNLRDTSAELLIGDVSDRDLVRDAVSAVDVVVHFAAESHNDNSLRDPYPFVTSNVLGTFELLEATRLKGARFHHISTDEVFGDLPIDGSSRFELDTPYNPSSPYSATKAASDHLVRAWIRSFGIYATISNCTNNYGPYQHVEKFIPRTITNLLQGHPAKVYGSGLQVRNWIHVDDHNQAVLSILEKGTLGETYHIATELDHVPNTQIVSIIAEQIGGHIEHVRDRPGHDQRYAMNSSKIRTELGWEPRYGDTVESLKEGLKDVINWYQMNQEWWSSEKARTEAIYSEIEGGN